MQMAMNRLFTSSRRKSQLSMLAAVLTAATVGVCFARPLDEVTAAKSLRVIAYLDNAPFSWEADGTSKGIDVDLGRAIARELGVDAEVLLRMQGENQDDDLRGNVWRGPLTGGGVGDIMMHVPVDKEFALRNKEAVIGNPYYQERVAVAIHPELTGDKPTFDVFKDKKISVQVGTVSDYFLMTYQDGALIENIAHHVKPAVGAKEFTAKETAAWMGVRSAIEALLHDTGAKATFVEPPMDGIYRSDWIVGMAWKENSRDLGYAIQAALEKIRQSGELERIFAAYGVSYTPPPVQ
jgi:polar amino acid transport system substrate-binding protein